MADPQNAPTGFDSPQSQGSTSDFEHCYTNIYFFQTSLMWNPNRLDFKTLQLAGVKTPISQTNSEKKNFLFPTKWRREAGDLTYLIQKLAPTPGNQGLPVDAL